MKVVYGESEAVAEWVQKRIPWIPKSGFGKCQALGVADGNKPIAGVVYNEWVPEFKTIAVSMAASDPRWASRSIIYELLSYPFDELDIWKVWGACPITNKRALKFDEGMGFKREATLSDHFGRKNHAIVFRMKQPEFHERFADLRERLAA